MKKYIVTENGTEKRFENYEHMIGSVYKKITKYISDVFRLSDFTNKDLTILGYYRQFRDNYKNNLKMETKFINEVISHTDLDYKVEYKEVKKGKYFLNESGYRQEFNSYEDLIDQVDTLIEEEISALVYDGIGPFIEDCAEPYNAANVFVNKAYGEGKERLTEKEVNDLLKKIFHLPVSVQMNEKKKDKGFER